MKTIKFAKKMFLFTWVFFFIYNTYFGWNYDAQSIAEANCDQTFIWSIKIALFIYLLPIFQVYEKVVKLLVD